MGSEAKGTGHRRALRAVDGYPSGTDAPQAATALAVAKLDRARSVVLVEGVSDQIAVEAVAERHGRDLQQDGTVVLPIGGAQAIPNALRRLGSDAPGVRLSGLCDKAEAPFYHRALAAARLLPSRPITGEMYDDLATAGFFVCDVDLEDELIRAASRNGVESVLAQQNDLRPFTSLQKQPAWRDLPFEAQMQRFLGAQSGRKSRYARAIIMALAPEDIPRPLADLVAGL